MTAAPARKRARLGLTRTFQTSRLFLGLTVEDNLYLGVLGVRPGHLRPVRLAGRDGPMRERARELAERVGLKDELGTLVSSLSHGEQRQLEVAMARAGDPKLMMLDEPAAGLSRGERVLLTELLLDLDREITLILIEHDMDVALTVAERVTMMHDGRVIVEGTPAEIRANELVHDLYLGRAHYDEPGAAAMAEPLLAVSGLTRSTGGRRSCTASRSSWAPSPSRSSGETAWARRRSASRSWA